MNAWALGPCLYFWILLYCKLVYFIISQQRALKGKIHKALSRLLHQKSIQVALKTERHFHRVDVIVESSRKYAKAQAAAGQCRTHFNIFQFFYPDMPRLKQQVIHKGLWGSLERRVSLSNSWSEFVQKSMCVLFDNNKTKYSTRIFASGDWSVDL